MHEDERWMRRSLELAERGRGHVEPNPLVGAVVVRDGSVVGEGYHERYGAAHAEVHALAAAGAAARGATIYTTLEPCCHHGKTPPCSDAILAAGVARVVTAMSDPFERVASRGIELLRAAGVTVDVGLLESEARVLNAPYLKLLGTGRPYVHAKWAMTLDGKIATAGGESKWISGSASRRVAHQLRGRMDAIIVGIGTVLADDPLLTARPPGPRRAVRVVLDSRARLPLESQLVKTARDVPVLVVTAPHAPHAARDALTAAGCECLALPRDSHGIRIPDLLDQLGQRRMTNVLVEGGSETLGCFHDHAELDELHAFVAAKLLGGAARTPIAGLGHARIGDATLFQIDQIRMIDGDCLIHAVRRTDPRGTTG